MLDKPPGCLQVYQLVKMTLVYTQVENDASHCLTFHSHTACALFAGVHVSCTVQSLAKFLPAQVKG